MMTRADAFRKNLEDELAVARRLLDAGENGAAALSFAAVAHYARHLAVALREDDAERETAA